MMSRARPSAIALAALAAVALLFSWSGSALGHGDEEDAFAETPARNLVQQALGLLSQADEPAEAAERLEAALESKDTDGVRLPLVREGLASLEDGDDRAAARHLNEALATAEPASGDTAPAAPGEGDGAAAPPTPAEEAETATEEALAHAEEFEPARGSEEWTGLILGVGAISAGAALLLLGRRRRPAGAGFSPGGGT